MEIRVNGEAQQVDADPDTPLLWVLRDHLHLTGTKYGCGIAMCGACTVLIDGRPARACSTPVGSLGERAVVTIEGAAARVPGRRVQAAWIAEQVPQCGYCQSGQILSAIALLEAHGVPDDAQIDAAMKGNLCRCGTYSRIRRAIHRAAAAGGEEG